MTKLLFIGFLCLTAAFVFPQENQKKIPNVWLKDLEGKKVQLKSYLGKGPLIINFWATWCNPCQEEMVELQKIYDDFCGKGLTIISISIDDQRSIGKVKPLIKSKNYNFLFLLDINSDAARDFYVQDIPNSFIVDQNGFILYSHRGFKKGDELEMIKAITEMVKSKK